MGTAFSSAFAHVFPIKQKKSCLQQSPLYAFALDLDQDCPLGKTSFLKRVCRGIFHINKNIISFLID
jgi:hypothetical protein